MNLVLYLVIGLLLTFAVHCIEGHEVSNCWHAPGGKAIVIAATIAGIVLWLPIVVALIIFCVKFVLIIITANNSSPRAN